MKLSCETSKQCQNFLISSGRVLGRIVCVLTLNCSSGGFVSSLGRNKFIINHLGRLFVTSDAATTIKEIEVQYPAAKLLAMPSQAQDAEVT